jgi:hypothetical protein
MRRREAPRGPWRPNDGADKQRFEGNTMKIFVAALAFAAIAAFAVSTVLDTIQRPSSVAFTTGGARVGDPGNNLIGPS